MADKPIIVITGHPQWAEVLYAQFGETYTIKHYPTANQYVDHLVDDYAALILVDGGDSQWRFWATTPKTSPATRRIPVFLISDKPEHRQNGLLAGADMVISLDELTPQLVGQYARLPDAEQMERLTCDCLESLPELGKQGIQKFNQREFYKQHDLFEELWMATESPVRDLYRAVLQVGIAYEQITRGNYRGAKKMLLRSIQWLMILPDICQGVDVAQFKQDAHQVRIELERLGENNIREFDQSLLKPVRLIEP